MSIIFVNCGSVWTDNRIVMIESPVNAIVIVLSDAAAGAAGGDDAWNHPLAESDRKRSVAINRPASEHATAQRGTRVMGLLLEIERHAAAQRPRGQDVGDASKRRARHIADGGDGAAVRHVEHVEAQVQRRLR